MVASVFKKIRFVRLCARLTMNSELLIALCDRINHLKKLACSVKNMSECIWQLSGDVLGGLKSVPKPFWNLLRPFWEGLGWFLGGLGWVLRASKSILSASSGLFGSSKWSWIDFGMSLEPKWNPKPSSKEKKNRSEMRIRFTHVFKQQKLILNNPPMKIRDFGMSRDVQTLLHGLRKQVLTALIDSCRGLVWDPANFGVVLQPWRVLGTPPWAILQAIWAAGGRHRGGRKR